MTVLAWFAHTSAVWVERAVLVKRTLRVVGAQLDTRIREAQVPLVAVL